MPTPPFDVQALSQDPQRFQGIVRPYAPDAVDRLSGRTRIAYSLAHQGAERLWELLHSRDYVPALGALTGSMAVQQVKAGLEAIYLSGWQVAADANTAGQMYPDQGLYPANSAPQLVRQIQAALLRSEAIEHAEGLPPRQWLAPIVADAEAGFGGPLNAHELMKAMIEAGAAGVHFEDQHPSQRKCGHLGGKVLAPTSHFIQTLVAARLAADIMRVPTLIMARTDADAAQLIASDIDPTDAPFILDTPRSPEGYYPYRGGLEAATQRALSFAPYADLLWCETSEPDLKAAAAFAEAVHARFPGKLLAYNCSPSFNWKKQLTDTEIAHFQRELGAMGYRFQFITLAGFHSLNHGMFSLAHAYARQGMSAYAALQAAEFASEKDGYTATRHQREVGAGYFDLVADTISQGQSSTQVLGTSTEASQF